MPLAPSLPRLRFGLGRSANRPARYSADEVRTVLGRAEAADSRGEAILATAAVPSTWVDYLSVDDAWALGRASVKLPSVLVLYRSGLSFEEIGRRLGVFAGPWLAERALDVASRCIAERLNDRGTPAAHGAV